MLKIIALKRECLEEFVTHYNRDDRKPNYSECILLKDDGLENSDNLPESDVAGLEIIRDQEAGLEKFY